MNTWTHQLKTKINHNYLQDQNPHPNTMITDQIQLEVAVGQIELEQISMSAMAMVYIMSAASPVQQLRYYQAQMELPTHQLTCLQPTHYKYNLLGWCDPGAL